MTKYKAIKRIENKLKQNKKVNVATLIKYDLNDIMQDEKYNHLINFSKKNVNPLKKPEPVVEPKFNSDDIVNFIKNYYIKNLKTQKIYLNKYSKISFTSDDLINNLDSIIDIENDKSVKHILSPISTFLKHNFVGKFPELLQKITESIGKAIEFENVRAIIKNKETLVISGDEMIEKYKHYLETEELGNHSSYYEKLTDGLILGFYVNFPLRDDFGNVSFENKLETGSNFLDLKKHQITILPKKGQKEQRIFDLPEDLIKLLDESLKLFPRNYLFINSYGNFIKRFDKKVTIAFKRIFPQIPKVTINDIRRAFTMYSENAGEKEYLEMLKVQSHSLNTSRIFYVRKNKE